MVRARLGRQPSVSSCLDLKVSSYTDIPEFIYWYNRALLVLMPDLGQHVLTGLESCIQLRSTSKGVLFVKERGLSTICCILRFVNF